MRAFIFAKDSEKAKEGDEHGDNFIEKKEFRVFLLALAQRFEYW